MDERRNGLISMSLHQELPASYRPGGSDGDQEFEAPFLQRRVRQTPLRRRNPEGPMSKEASSESMSRMFECEGEHAQ